MAIQDTPLPRPREEGDAARENRLLDVLAWTMLGEAANQGETGLAAIAHVVLNRANSGQFPSDPVDVALQPKQFSTWNSGQGGNNPTGRWSRNSAEFQNAREIAAAVLKGEVPDPTRGATHYWAPKGMKAMGYAEDPYWASSEERRAGNGRVVLGDHVFLPRQGQEPPQPAVMGARLRDRDARNPAIPFPAPLPSFRGGAQPTAAARQQAAPMGATGSATGGMGTTVPPFTGEYIQPVPRNRWDDPPRETTYARSPVPLPPPLDISMEAADDAARRRYALKQDDPSRPPGDSGVPYNALNREGGYVYRDPLGGQMVPDGVVDGVQRYRWAGPDRFRPAVMRQEPASGAMSAAPAMQQAPALPAPLTASPVPMPRRRPAIDQPGAGASLAELQQFRGPSPLPAPLPLVNPMAASVQNMVRPERVGSMPAALPQPLPRQSMPTGGIAGTVQLPAGVRPRIPPLPDEVPTGRFAMPVPVSQRIAANQGLPQLITGTDVPIPGAPIPPLPMPFGTADGARQRYAMNNAPRPTPAQGLQQLIGLLGGFGMNPDPAPAPLPRRRSTSSQTSSQRTTSSTPGRQSSQSSSTGNDYGESSGRRYVSADSGRELTRQERREYDADSNTFITRTVYR